MIKKTILLIAVASLVSCSIKLPDAAVPNGASINFSFKVSSADGSDGAVTVGSYDAFLTTNYEEPFAFGANPFGDDYITQVNAEPDGTANLVFENIPDGGPYYAVVVAYDQPIAIVSRNNITEGDSGNEPDPDNPFGTEATDNQLAPNVAKSFNSVSITDSTPVFSNGGTSFVINVRLTKNKRDIDTVIAPAAGVATNLPIAVIPR